MIQADALTNPFIFRSCRHVYGDVIATPRRCLACRAIDHGVSDIPVHRLSSGVKAGYVLGSYPYAEPDKGCRFGHPASAMGVTGGNQRYCRVCQAEKKRNDAEFCPKGHLRQVQRYTQAGRTVIRLMCQTCRTGKSDA